ncbi:MAG: helix-turn-helix transcriptional regulator [Lachnospiraceae bacterium]|nr:helix-turn-helix transcriptional regulator [Lachnospiraceae bacterium]
MTISDRIFRLMKEKGMTQKQFSEATGIAQSSISDWKRKRTNPVSDKIMIICHVLDVTPEELLSGTEDKDQRRNPSDYLVVKKDTDLGSFISRYQSLDDDQRARVQGYLDAICELKKDSTL